MSNNTVFAIAVADIRPACAGEPDVIERIRKAMKKAQDFWLDTDDDLRFRGAVGAAMLESTEEEQDKFKRSMVAVRSIGAMLSGVPVDVEHVLKEAEDTYPLIKLWREVKDTL